MMTMFAVGDQLLSLAAVIYRPEDDIDGILDAFAFDLLRAGHRIGGVIQRNDGAGRSSCSMHLVDLMSGEAIPISQALGPEARACSLDPAGLAIAALAIGRAVAAGVELVVVNKFSKREAAGSGFRAEIAEAVVAGLPVLTAVPEALLDVWTSFTGGYGTILCCDRLVIEDWWRDIDRRAAGRRAASEALVAAG